MIYRLVLSFLIAFQFATSTAISSEGKDGSDVIEKTIHHTVDGDVQSVTETKRGWVIEGDVAEGVDRVTIERASQSELNIAKSRNLRERMKRYIEGVRAGTRATGKHVVETAARLPVEAAVFYAAIGALSMYQCSIQIKDNPSACEDFATQLMDPLGYMSFFMFVLTSGSVDKVARLGGWLSEKSTATRKILFQSLGMAAGLMASEISFEFMHDPNVQKIVKYNVSGRGLSNTPIDKENYDKAFDSATEKWLNPSSLGAYAPKISSLVGSFIGLAGAKILIAKLMKSAAIRTAGRLGAKGAFWGIKKSAQVFSRYGTQEAAKKAVEKTTRHVVVTGLCYLYTWGPKLRYANVLFAVGDLALMIALDHWIAKYTNRYYLLEDTAMKLRYHESAILDHLSKLHSGSREKSEQIKGKLRQFLYRDLLGKSSDSNRLDIMDDLGLYDLNQNGLLFQNSIENSRFGNEDKAFGYAINTHITEHKANMALYRDALSSVYQNVQMSWDRFFGPFEKDLESARRFYKMIIEARGEVDFSNRTKDELKAILDAVFFNVYTLTEAAKVNPNLLFAQVKAASYGLSPKFVRGDFIEGIDRTRANPKAKKKFEEVWVKNLNTLNSKLFSTLSRGSREPTEETQLYTRYFNAGFLITDFNKNQKYDYQLKTKAVEMGLDVSFVSSLERPNLEIVIDFLESKPSWDQPIYVLGFNLSMDSDKITKNFVMKMSPEVLVSEIGGEQVVESHMLDKVDDALVDMENTRPGVVAEGRDYYDRRLGGPILSENGIQFDNQLEKMLSDFVCANDQGGWKNKMTQRRGFSLFQGHLEFNPPRMYSTRPNLCQKIKGVHDKVTVQVDGREQTYSGLLDYMSKKIFIKSGFDAYWASKVESVVTDVWASFMIKQNQALYEEASQIFDNPTYGHFLSLKDIKIGGFGLPLSFNIFHPVLEKKTDSIIGQKKYANGVVGITVQTVEYYADLIRIGIPKMIAEDRINRIDEYLNHISYLSSYPGGRFAKVRDEYARKLDRVLDTAVESGAVAASERNQEDLFRDYNLLIGTYIKDLRMELAHMVDVHWQGQGEEQRAYKSYGDKLISGISEAVRFNRAFESLLSLQEI